MAEYTKNLNLKKPAPDDFVDVADLNGNFDVIDEKIAEAAEGGKQYYGTCTTAAATAAKVVTADRDFVLETGAAIDVKFSYANSAASPTLNVGGTGAKYIKKYGNTAPNTYQWYAGAMVRFVYDGTYWIMEGGTIATTTYYGATKLNSSTSSTSTTEAATPSAVKAAMDKANAALPKAGGTMTGNLVLNADPTANLGAATKQYVDKLASEATDDTKVNKSGDTMTGALVIGNTNNRGGSIDQVSTSRTGIKIETKPSVGANGIGIVRFLNYGMEFAGKNYSGNALTEYDLRFGQYPFNKLILASEYIKIDAANASTTFMAQDNVDSHNRTKFSYHYNGDTQNEIIVDVGLSNASITGIRDVNNPMDVANKRYVDNLTKIEEYADINASISQTEIPLILQGNSFKRSGVLYNLRLTGSFAEDVVMQPSWANISIVCDIGSINLANYYGVITMSTNVNGEMLTSGVQVSGFGSTLTFSFNNRSEFYNKTLRQITIML